jgi:hypothetical protein
MIMMDDKKYGLVDMCKKELHQICERAIKRIDIAQRAEEINNIKMKRDEYNNHIDKINKLLRWIPFTWCCLKRIETIEDMKKYLDIKQSKSNILDSYKFNYHSNLASTWLKIAKELILVCNTEGLSRVVIDARTLAYISDWAGD